MAQKKIYKVWDIAKGKYLSTGKKSSWQSKTWALNAVDTECTNYEYKQLGGSLSSLDRQNSKINRMKNFEIHEFELIRTSSYNAAEKFIDKVKIQNEISQLSKEIIQKTELLKTDLNVNLSYYSIMDFYNKGVWSSEINLKIKPIKLEIETLELKIKELNNLIKNL